MTKKTLILSCCFLCMGAMVSWATPTMNTTHTNEMERSMEGRLFMNPDSVKALPQLLADKLELGKKLEAAKKAEQTKLREQLESEALEFPAEDLYGEDSWSQHVNPFTRVNEIDIPSTYKIDCSNFVMPVKLSETQVTSNFGYRRRFHRMHYGIDLDLNTGDTIRAAFDGKVRVQRYDGRGYGHFVIMRHPNGLETVYGHMSRPLVKEGQIIKAGQAIGLGGNTGRSFGSHLHFETRFMGIAINPASIFDFHNGVPYNDYYVFRRGGSDVAGRTSYATRGGGSRSNHYASKRGGASAKAPVVHRVRRGDNLSSIASRYGVSVSKLCRTNGISAKTKLVAGKTSLRIPD